MINSKIYLLAKKNMNEKNKILINSLQRNEIDCQFIISLFVSLFKNKLISKNEYDLLVKNTYRRFNIKDKGC